MVHQHPILPNPLISDEIYLLCGQIAMDWPHVEFAMQDWIVMMRQWQRADLSNFPVSFKRRAEEIKQRLKAPMFAYIRDETLAAISDMGELRRIRVTIVHGICNGTSNGSLLFQVSGISRNLASIDGSIALSRLEAAPGQLRTLRQACGKIMNKLRRNHWLNEF